MTTSPIAHPWPRSEQVNVLVTAEVETSSAHRTVVPVTTSEVTWPGWQAVNLGGQEVMVYILVEVVVRVMELSGATGLAVGQKVVRDARTSVVTAPGRQTMPAAQEVTV